MDNQIVLLEDLGLASYKGVWDYQEQLLAANVQIKSTIQSTNTTPVENLQTRHHLLLVEHPPVYTLGKSGNMDNVLIGEEERNRLGLEFFKINRGGDITFHGPGQLVVYPIFDLEKFYTDIGRYLRNLEEVVIKTLGDYGIKGDRSHGETGVWIDPFVKGRERKICAIGVRCSRWITMHGLAFNITTDLDYFNNIIPCGIKEKQVTSLSRELGTSVEIDEVKEKVKRYFAEVFGVQFMEKATALQ